MLDFLSSMLPYLATAMTVLGALVTFVAVLAPLTKTDIDNKLLALLVKLHDVLVRFVPNAASHPKYGAPVNAIVHKVP